MFCQCLVLFIAYTINSTLHYSCYALTAVIITTKTAVTQYQLIGSQNTIVIGIPKHVQCIQTYLHAQNNMLKQKHPN